MRKILIAATLALVSCVTHAQFLPGQILTAAALNNAFAAKTDNAAAAITGGTITGLSSPVPMASGGTGAATASAALSNLGAMPIAGGNFTGAAGISFDQNNATRFTVSNQSSGTSALTGIDFESFGGSWKIDVPQSVTFVNPLIFKFGTTEVARLSPTGAALQVTGGASFTVRPTFNGAIPWDSANFTPPLTGTSGSIGGSALAAGACSSGTVSIAGSTTGMAVAIAPATYLGDGIFWHGYVSTGGTVTVKVCASASATPTASTYNVRVIP
ncbi:hypothetical protein AB4Y32_15900 [Paraburkholderia phymatum]|uniref:Uncharacterized protein n=1 Tax=Paraburkholderia phymatum TaxID=148447 RepID=A0ACC6U100_9BURK